MASARNSWGPGRRVLAFDLAKLRQVIARCDPFGGDMGLAFDLTPVGQTCKSSNSRLLL